MKLKTFSIFGVAAIGMLCLSSVANAAIVTTTTADARVRNDGNVASGSMNPIEVGGHGAAASGFRSSYVMPFELPTLGAGEIFGSASLTFYLEQIGTGIGTGEEADLYGLDRVDASDAAIAADWYTGPLDGSNTLLQDAILTENSTVGTVTSSGAALTDFLNTQYAGGANAGNFVFLRLSYNTDPPAGNERFRIQPFENDDLDPVATITYDAIAIPEPASFAMLAFADAGVAMRRRMRIA